MITIDTRSYQTVEESFARAADDLLNSYVLVVNDQLYRFLEVEFYYNDEGCGHADCYAHKHPEQQNHGTWYFHGSGVDITFGKEGYTAEF